MKAFSDLKEGKRALEVEKNRTSAIIENIIDPIIVINNRNQIELLNHSARKVLGFVKNYSEIAIDPGNNFSMNNFKKVVENEFTVSEIAEEEGGGDDDEELVIEVSGQETTYKIITAKVIDIHGEKLGTMKIFYNMTREKMLDKLKSEFITIAAHQLRTPLSAIKWVIKMVLDGDAGTLTPDQEQLLSKGYKSNERIITLVNDMLNVSRIEEGRFGYKMQPEDLSKALDGIIEALSSLINGKNIKFNLERNQEFPLLNIDLKKMTLVIQNLLENAIKYTPENGRINVRMAHDDNNVTISIQDNGIGIPKADQVKLFTKFYRAENALRLQTEGSGLGLFIVRNIVKEHGGNISFESEEGVGTTFTITLPIKFAPYEEGRRTSEI
jgi:signal transduction histidine kinase